MRPREPDACTADEYHGLIRSIDIQRRALTVRVSRTALDHLLQDHARLQREAGRPDS